jgi:2-dehydropantoate 2-reductase
MPAMISVAILGPGGVGGFLTGALERAGTPVTLVARPDTATRIEAHGLHVSSVRLGASFTVHPRVVTRLDEPVDVLFVASKATMLGSALSTVAADPGLVVPLLNGLAHRTPLAARFGERAVAGSIRVESDRPEPGRIVQTSPFLRVEMASDDPEVAARLAPVAELLEAAGVPAVVGPSEAQVVWSKLARLCALACMTSAYDLPIGPIRTTPELRDELKACVAEACEVGTAEGADLDPLATMRELDEAHPELGSSMQRDLRAGREPELDAIAVRVVETAHRYSIPTPTIERLIERIRARAA